jgi:hypothetical protein
LGGAALERKIASFGNYPRWSPDSSQILFQTRGFGLSCELYIVGLDGNFPRPIRTDLTDGTSAISATWHPNGKRISIWVWEIKPSAMPIFWTAPVERGGDKDGNRPGNPKDGGGYRREQSAWADSDFKFSWERSGTAIYFERTFRGGNSKAFAIESRRVKGWMFPFDANRGRITGAGRAVTSPGMEAWETSISRDGLSLAFLAKRSGRWELGRSR